LPEDCIIDLRQCYGGGAASSVAQWTRRTTTGVLGTVDDRTKMENGQKVPAEIPNGPDYSFGGDLVQATYNPNNYATGDPVTVMTIWKKKTTTWDLEWMPVSKQVRIPPWGSLKTITIMVPILSWKTVTHDDNPY
jgi:hypothetical protein